MQTRKIRGPRTEPSPIPMDSGLKDVATILIKTTGDFKSYWISCTTLETGNGSLMLVWILTVHCSVHPSSHVAVHDVTGLLCCTKLPQFRCQDGLVYQVE